jgi:hypothetical protein
VSPERQAAAAVDSASMVDGVRFSITGTEAVEAIAGAGLVILTAERAAAWVDHTDRVSVLLNDIAAEMHRLDEAEPEGSTRFDAMSLLLCRRFTDCSGLPLIARVRRAEAALEEIEREPKAPGGDLYGHGYNACRENHQEIARAALEARTDGE